MPANIRDRAIVDAAMPIGYGQTISQPTVVALMLQWLDPQPGDRVLDVGSGSGWTTALLSRLVAPTGYVDAVETIPELVTFGRQNCRRLGLTNVTFHHANRHLGWHRKAPFDRILVSAEAKRLPTELLEQLKTGGKLVIPVHHDILEIYKRADGHLNQTAHHGFVFVPLKG